MDNRYQSHHHPRDDDDDREHQVRFETAVLHRLGEIEKKQDRYFEWMEKFQTRVQALETTQSQIKFVGVAIASLTGIISMMLGKLWK